MKGALRPRTLAPRHRMPHIRWMRLAHLLFPLGLFVFAVGCSSSESVDDIAPEEDTAATGDTALPDTFVAKDSSTDSSADSSADSGSDVGEDTTKADGADAATDGASDAKTDATADAADATADVATDAGADATADATTDATTDADVGGDSVLADVLSDVSLGGTCTLDSECISGLKCCAGGAAGLPKHCTAPTSGGTCPLVP